MTVTVPKTKAEQALGEHFEKTKATLPGGGWVGELRARAFGALSSLGLPHRRVEEWKYTDLRDRMKSAFAPIAALSRAVSAAEVDAALGPFAGIDAARIVFVDGAFVAGLSRTDALAGTCEVIALGGLLAKAPGWLAGKFDDSRIVTIDAVEAINLAFMADGAMLKVKAGCDPGRPVLIVNVRATAEPRLTAVRNIIAVEAGARLTLAEIDVVLPGAAADAQAFGVTDVDVADGASVQHIAATLDAGASALVSTWRARLGRDAVYRAFQLTAGVRLARRQGFITYLGEGGKLDFSGSFLGTGAQHIDTTLVIDHAVPHCESRELFKGVLAERARGIFQGKVIVREGAQKTDGKQMAQALMLSEDAEFDSKPELEIYADDVVCGHGSTCAEIDPDLVFYCQSRGLPEAEARALLVQSFVGEAIDKVEETSLRDALAAVAELWLARGDGTSTPAPSRG